MTYKFSNFARSTLASSINNVVTTLSVASGDGAKFPNPGVSEKFMIVVTNNLGQREVMRVTARATDTFTVVRGQEGTTAIAFNAGDRVSHRLTAGAIDAAFGGAIPSATGQAGKLITSDGTTASYSDTLAGPLTLSYASPVFTLNAAASGQTRYSRYRTAGTTRWETGVNGTAESGANAGSDLVEVGYSDAGALLGTWKSVSRATGRRTYVVAPTGAGPAVDFQIPHNSAQRVRAYNSDAGNGALAGFAAETNDGQLRVDASSTALRSLIGIGASIGWTGGGTTVFGSFSASTVEFWYNNTAYVRLTGGKVDIPLGSGTLTLNTHPTRAMLGAIALRSSAGSTSVGAHGGTRAPDWWQIRYRLKNAVQGYAAGDIANAAPTGSTNCAIARFDATNAYLVQQSGSIAVLNASTGAATTLTSTDLEAYIMCGWL